MQSNSKQIWDAGGHIITNPPDPQPNRKESNECSKKKRDM